MSFLWTDGFDSFGATADLIRKYAGVGSSIAFNSTGGRTGGGCLELDGTTGGQAIVTPADFSVASGADAAAGFWFKASAAPGSRSMLAAWQNGGGIISNIGLDTSGRLVHLDTTTGLKATGVANICDGTYHWIEIKDNLSNSSGAKVAYADGAAQYNFNDLFVNNNGPSTSFAFYTISGITISIDDLVLYDAGNDGMDSDSYPYGSRQITTRRPNGDSAVQLTPAVGGTNYTNVDEAVPDLADYVQSGTSGDTDLYDYQDLGFTPSVIHAVVINSLVKAPSGGSANFYSVAKSSSTQSDGSSTAAPASAQTIQRVIAVDPATSAAWGVSGFNAAKFGIKVA